MLFTKRSIIALTRPASGRACTMGSVFAGIALILAGAAGAQMQRDDIRGEYAIDASAGDDIEAAINRGTAELNFAIRPLARRLIAKSNPPYKRIMISRDGATASVQLDSRPPIRVPLDGSSVRWIREDGGIDIVSGEWSYPAFAVYFKGEDGARVQKYVLEPDARTLKLYVEITSPRLPAPIEYMLVYRRS
jgi:hypothetical protein